MSLREGDPADILMTTGFLITLAGGFLATVNHQSMAYDIGVAVGKSAVLAVALTIVALGVAVLMPVSSYKEVKET